MGIGALCHCLKALLMDEADYHSLWTSLRKTRACGCAASLRNSRIVFGEAVTGGSKAICVAAGNSRRKADVVVCVDFRRYVSYENLWTENYVPGICFFTTSGSRIVTFPKPHSENASTKDEATSSWCKPMVRIHKDMRNKLVAANALSAGVAPSYYIEGLLYNAPNELFGTKNTYGDSFVSIFN
jgi:hypothetical protein